MLGVTTRTVRRLGETGTLSRVKLGRRSTRYRLADVLAFIDSCTSNATAGNGGAAETARHRRRDED